MLDIPKNKSFPAGAMQCDGCGGNGCEICGDRGWVTDAMHARCCLTCHKPLAPAHVAVYCSTACAVEDSGSTPITHPVICLHCGGNAFIFGPRGGLSVNICCADPDCRHWFNWSPVLDDLQDLGRVEPP